MSLRISCTSQTYFKVIKENIDTRRVLRDRIDYLLAHPEEQSDDDDEVRKPFSECRKLGWLQIQIYQYEMSGRLLAGEDWSMAGQAAMKAMRL